MSPRPRLLPLALAAAAACAGDQEIERPAPIPGEVPVEYPLELWDRGVEGETLLNVRVTEEGTVDSAVVLRSSGHAALDSAALRGVAGLRFRPARKGGKRIKVWARVPVRFTRKPPPGPPPEASGDPPAAPGRP